MADRSSSPLLGESAASRPTTRHSEDSNDSHERSPLLSQSNDTQRYDGHEPNGGDRSFSPAASSLRSLQNGGGSTKSSKSGRRWPTYIAISVLSFLMVGIVVGVFFAPAMVEEYAKEAVVVEPTNLSIHEITSTGVIARVQANFRLDAAKVKNPHVRNVGRLGTWIARKVETSESTINIYAKTVNLLIGSVAVPKIVVDIRNGHTNTLDFLTNVRPGDVNGLRQLANDWLDGRIKDITVRGEGNIGVKSGLINLGQQKISEEMHFEGSDIPTLPQYNITRLNVYEQPLPEGGRGMAADVQVSLVNEYPLGITVPPLKVDIFVPDCDGEPSIQLGDATSGEIIIKPHSDVVVNAGGIVKTLPKSLTKACPGSASSPLDIILGDYLDGKDAKLFVRGSRHPDASTPDWIAKIMSSVSVPIPFPGRTFDNLVKEFSLDNTSFNLPSPFADEGDDDANPRISSDITVVAGMPKDMNFGVNVTRLSATADVYYKKKMMGVLDMSKWQQSSSRRLALKDGFSDLEIKSNIIKAPLRIKDEDVFEDVISAFYFGKGVELDTKARLTFEVSTVLGNFIVRDMPAEATVPIKPPIKGGKQGLPPLHTKMHDLSVTGTTKTALNLRVKVDFTNPTNYSAVIPYFNLHILHNNSIIGDATVRDQLVTPGNVTDFTVDVSWDPAMGGEKGQIIGRELLSQYISGYNTTLTVKLHKDSISHQPDLGKMLSKYSLTVPWPRVSNPDPETGKEQHLIRDATFHILSKTAQFTLVSPFSQSTIFIDHMNATALYNHTETIGRIVYDEPFKVPPGTSQSPRLPVDVDGSGMGFPELRKAIGGNLKLDARGKVTVRLGEWTERVWYVGEGIGSSIRL